MPHATQFATTVKSSRATVTLLRVRLPLHRERAMTAYKTAGRTGRTSWRSLQFSNMTFQDCMNLAKSLWIWYPCLKHDKGTSCESERPNIESSNMLKFCRT